MSPSIHENILRVLSWIEIALIIYILKCGIIKSLRRILLFELRMKIALNITVNK